MQFSQKTVHQDARFFLQFDLIRMFSFFTDVLEINDLTGSLHYGMLLAFRLNRNSTRRQLCNKLNQQTN